MQKPKPQSTQAPFCTTFCMKLFLFFNTIWTLLKQLFWWKPTWTSGLNTPWCKDKTRSEQKSRKKIKAKCSSRKREHSLNEKSENWSVLGNEKRSIALSKTWCDPTIYCSKQKKRKLKAKTTDAPRKTHSAWSNKNIVCWKVTWFLPMKKGCLEGIPKIWCLYLLDISWGDMGIPKLELLSILQLISSFSNPYTWKLHSYKTSHNSISNVSINIIMNQPFLV
jgi:hypothetical protein